eukprot:CAMPEP_0182443924 /NCGR_PEP_ID=MMETSP1172-20130603/2534_1 /TAXON_ID=708627 /ORGANISM="Timspurckia oligopyrenoides, Strain CCMP3278" /LENGTH=278 /DNA_ID=CAMNT_0024639349 /DNA_START=122 /DNA_END=958 /DNA_ORIENTATION=-
MGEVKDGGTRVNRMDLNFLLNKEEDGAVGITRQHQQQQGLMQHFQQQAQQSYPIPSRGAWEECNRQGEEGKSDKPSSDGSTGQEDQERDASPITSTSQKEPGSKSSNDGGDATNQQRNHARCDPPDSAVKQNPNESHANGGDSSNRMDWTHEEDEILEALLDKFGEGQWWKIARGLKNRTPSQVRARYRYVLLERCSRREFTPEEDRFILSQYSKMGSKWSTIALRMEKRSGNSVKNRYRLLARREKKREAIKAEKNLEKQTNISVPTDLSRSKSTRD